MSYNSGEMLTRYITQCSGSVVVTAYDFESGRPGSNPEIFFFVYVQLFILVTCM